MRRHSQFNKKLMAKAGMAAATLTVGAVLLASCSSSGSDGDATDSKAAAESTAVESTAVESSDEEEIKQVTQSFVTAMNMGKVSDLPTLLCSEKAATVPAGQDLPESEQKAQIDSFSTITVTGDTATTTITVSAVGDASEAPQSVDMLYVNEDGWKICQ